VYTWGWIEGQFKLLNFEPIAKDPSFLPNLAQGLYTRARLELQLILCGILVLVPKLWTPRKKLRQGFRWPKVPSWTQLGSSIESYKSLCVVPPLYMALLSALSCFISIYCLLLIVVLWGRMENLHNLGYLKNSEVVNED